MIDGTVTEIDAISGLRRRSAFVREAVLAAIDRHRRLLEAAGMLRGTEHDWDWDPAALVNRQRSSNAHRVG